MIYWETIVEKEALNLAGTLTRDCTDFKPAASYEETIDEIVPPLATRLCQPNCFAVNRVVMFLRTTSAHLVKSVQNL